MALMLKGFKFLKSKMGFIWQLQREFTLVCPGRLATGQRQPVLCRREACGPAAHGAHRQVSLDADRASREDLYQGFMPFTLYILIFFTSLLPIINATTHVP